MHMNMPPIGGHHGAHHPLRRSRPIMMAVVMFHGIFSVAATVCFLGAVNRAANALKLESRIKALKAVPDAFTEEERVELIHEVTTRAIGPY
jgi:hypothetical protein